MVWRMGATLLVVMQSMAEGHSALIPHGHPHPASGSPWEGLGLGLVALLAIAHVIRHRGPLHGG